MLYHPFALLLCASPQRTAAAVRALSAVTNLVHVDCSRRHTPALDWLEALPPRNRSLLIISGAHSPPLLLRIAAHLDDHAIDYATVGVSDIRPLDFGEEFPLGTYDLLGVIHTPRATPRLRSPTLTTHTLRTASRLVPPRGIQIEMPLRSLRFIRPPGSVEATRRDTLRDEALSLGSLYCKHFNRDLPDTCAFCETELKSPHGPCPACGTWPDVPPQRLRPHQGGGIAASHREPNDCSAEFVCLDDD